MRNFTLRVLPVLIAVNIFLPSFSQTKTNTDILKQAAAIQAAKEKILYQKLQTLALQKGWPMRTKGKDGKITLLVGIDSLGLPLYLSTQNNIIAAATLGTSSLWPGGSTGLNLSGSSASVKDKLAIWDGGQVRATHQELTGRVVQRDNTSDIVDHSTHVAGTLIAAGVNPLAKGMSFGEQELVAYDFNNDFSEMLNESPGLLISNHSYGYDAGWTFNTGQNRWEFLGNFDANEDYKFGYYSSQAQAWDSIAYNAPFYLIVKSAGNSRDQNGPAVGQPYWRYNSSGVMANAGNRPPGISNNDSYDILSLNSTAKNILLIGAVNPIPTGYTQPSDVVQSTFSSWGPTDDGRIKPDVVADGVGLLSCIGTADNAYDIYSGTSMSSPNAAGSLLLLQEYYAQLHGGTFMRSATLKGLVIHTADEAGFAPGPDYQNGWGLIDMKKAASVITANNTTDIIQEGTLDNADNSSYTLPVIASGNGTISATISWTDPKATVEPIATALNNTTPKLVNDLDIVIKKGAVTYRPWILTPSSPSSAATTGDNTLDNEEKVELPDVIPGATYTIQITHKGTLQRNTQAYSLIASGVGGHAYCASAPTSTAGAKIDSVSFSNIQNKNVAGCTSYSDFTNLTGNLQPSQTLPIFIRLTSCDASAVDKIVKVYIDANNDGDFDDPGENIATSGVINGNGNYTGNITVPSSLTQGKYTLLRIVMVETSSAENVTPCGTYTKGETQDYRVLLTAPSIDAGVTAIISPAAGDCRTGEQYATIRIRNLGTGNISNVPVSGTVKQGATTIATLAGAFAGSIPAGTDVEYTFQTPFALAANTSYTITATVALIGDQVPGNSALSATITTGADAATPTGTANICGTSANLTATSSSVSSFNWYSSATATTALANGSPATTSTILSTYYLSSGEVGKLGPANKIVFSDGGYNQFSPGVRFTTTIPTSIKTARLYIGTAGEITFSLRQLVSYDNNTGGYTYYPISSKTLNVTPTVPTPPVLGAPDNDPADLGAIYYLGIDIPTAGDYILAISYADGASLFRNNNITTTNYPYTIPGVISMTGNTSFLAGNTNYFQGYYYYFYDMVAKPTVGCPSPRAAIVATTSVAPTITVTGNVLTSSSATGNQWYFNGTSISGANGQTYTATASGTYTVQVYDAFGCNLQSNSINLTLTPVTNVDPREIGLIVSPNPTSSGQFNVQLETNTKATLYISLANTVGQKVYQFTIPDFTGRLSKLITPGKLSAGVYYLQVQHDKKMYVEKIVVTQ